MKRKVSLIPSPLLAVVAIGCLVSAAVAQVQSPAQTRTPLSFRGKTVTLHSSVKLPPGHLTGENGVLVIDGGKDRRCSVEISQSVVDDVKLQVREGSELILRGVLLRRCQIYAEPKAVVIIDGSGLEKCELNGFADSRRGSPSMRITNSVLAEPAALKSINWLGLEIQDCHVYDQKSPQTGLMATEVLNSTFSDLARSPRVRYTAFTNCELHPYLFYAASHCTFSNCRIFGPPAAAGAPPSSTDIALPIRWTGGTPAVLPVIGRGVALQPVNDPFPGGCKLEHRWEGGVLSLASVPSNGMASALESAIPSEARLVSTGSSGGGSSGSRSASSGMTGGSGAEASVKLAQTSVNGLLVMPLPSGKEAGQVSKMTLTVMTGISEIHFGQPVGMDMTTALREVQKLMRLRHNELPNGQDFEISFEEKYSGKDGPSAAVACALLLESSLTGKTWDPAFAVTGDLNADGSVQPIGGVSAKIRGATNGACKIVAVPMKNEGAVSDVLVRDGPAPLFNIIVFGLSTFDEAMALAAAERTGPLKEAIYELTLMTDVLKRDLRAAPALLRTPQAVARLQSILTKAPHCLSAKFLLQYAQNRVSSKLTLAGSLEAADADAQGLVNAVQHDFNVTGNTLQLDEVGGSVNRLRNLRPLLDQRVWPYVDGMIDFGSSVRAVLLNPPKTYSRANDMVQPIRSAANRAQTEKKKLLSDPRVIEELGL